jgi:fructokinase
MKYDVYGIGNALVDKEFEVEDAFFSKMNIDKGIMTLVEKEQQDILLAELKATVGVKKRAGGGSAANSIFAVSYFGGSAYYACNVANDEPGDFYVKDLTAANIATNLGAERADGTTGKCLVMVTPDAERTMHTFLGISANVPVSTLNEEAIANSEYLYIEGYLVTSDESRATAIEARKLAEKNGVKTALTFSDPAMVQFFKDGLKDMLGNGVDLLFCNEQEALAMTDAQDIEQAAEQLKSLAKTFAITLGDKGALVFDGSQFITIAPHSVEAKDSNGAGDMFAGAFMYALTQGKDFATAGKLASLASATVVSQFGPRLDEEQHAPIKASVLG